MVAFANLSRRRNRGSGWPSLPSRLVSSRPPARIHGVRMSVPRIDSATLTGSRAGASPLRIAIVTPYSWTYPGGVNRHVEALAEALIDRGHELRVLAPWDPLDRLGRALHRAPPERRSRPDYLVGLGRTMGIGANGAVSNLSVFPDAVTKMRVLRSGGGTVCARALAAARQSAARAESVRCIGVVFRRSLLRVGARYADATEPAQAGDVKSQPCAMTDLCKLRICGQLDTFQSVAGERKRPGRTLRLCAAARRAETVVLKGSTSKGTRARTFRLRVTRMMRMGISAFRSSGPGL